MKPRVLITGFGPLPGQPDNPSATLVRGLRQIFAREPSGFELRAVVLKTEYATAWQKLKRELETFEPNIVICFGVAAGETGFRLEQQARNQCSTESPDAAGFIPKDSVIQADGALSHNATLPLTQILESLNHAHIDARLSDDAGDYLCNYTFFHLMAHATAHGSPARAGFIHIPSPDLPHTMTRQKLIQGARLIINTSQPLLA